MPLPDILTLPRVHDLAAPGWCHDGSRLNSHQIKAEFLRAHPAEAGTPGLPR